MPRPLVTIGVAFYNTAQTLAHLVRCVVAQTLCDWELLMVDDGSTDGGADIIRKVNDPRVTLLVNDRNIGRSATLNRITSVAKGKYIARLDADDMCATTRLHKQVAYMESEPSIDVSGTGMCFLLNDDTPAGDWRPPPTHHEICCRPNRTFGLAHGTIMGKRDWFVRNPYDPSLSMAIDFNLFYRTYRESRFGNITEPLYYYRIGPSFNLKKQLAARRASAKFLFRNHWHASRHAEAFASWLIQYGKFAATVTMFGMGLRERLLARRFESLSDADKDRYAQEIARIKATHLPMSRVPVVDANA